MGSESSSVAVVKAGFILRGTSLCAWCRSHGIDTGYASKALTGKQAGPKARELKARLMQASQAVD